MCLVWSMRVSILRVLLIFLLGGNKHLRQDVVTSSRAASQEGGGYLFNVAPRFVATSKSLPRWPTPPIPFWDIGGVEAMAVEAHESLYGNDDEGVRKVSQLGNDAVLGHTATTRCAVLLSELGLEASDGVETSCQRELGFSRPRAPPYNRKGELTYCRNHETRTCCERQDTERIRSVKGMHELSAECRLQTRTALCSRCDGDVGVGIKANQGHPTLCLGFCSRWFAACKEDFFAPSEELSRGAIHSLLVPCDEDYHKNNPRLVCAKAEAVASDDASEFCKLFGFGVGDHPMTCFDGTASALLKGAAPKEKSHTIPMHSTKVSSFVWRIVKGAREMLTEAVKVLLLGLL